MKVLYIVIMLFNPSPTQHSVKMECPDYDCVLKAVDEALYSDSRNINRIQVFDAGFYLPVDMMNITIFPPKEEFYIQ